MYSLADDDDCKEIVDELVKFKASGTVIENFLPRTFLRDSYFWVRTAAIDGEEPEEYEVNEKIADKIIKEYGDNEKCSETEYFRGKSIQKIVQKPLLFDNKLVFIRAFLLIASTNPVIAFYREGFVTYLPLLEETRVKIQNYLELLQ